MIKKNIILVIIALICSSTIHPSYAQMQEQYRLERNKELHQAGKKRPRRTTARNYRYQPSSTQYQSTSYSEYDNTQTSPSTYQTTQPRDYYQVSQAVQTEPQTYSSQPDRVSTLMGQITIVVSTGTRTMFNYPEQVSLQIPPQFSLTELSYGIELSMTIYPPTTGSNQQYLLVAFLKSANGSKVSQSIMQKQFNTLPSITTLYYNNQQLTQKIFFEKPSRFEKQEIMQLFNSKCPITQQFVIQIIDNQIVVS